MRNRIQAWQLSDHMALITGASQGIGYATARELALLGSNLLLVARHEDELEQARHELSDAFPDIQVLAFRADLTEVEERLAVFDFVLDLHLPLSLLINNLGGNQSHPVLDYAPHDYQNIFEKNVFCAYEMCRLAYPWLRAHPAASIVNVGSVAGFTHIRTGAPYGMAKAALHQLTRNLAVEWSVDGIRVNAVAPWYIRTRRSESALGDGDYLDQVLERTPLKRIGETEEVAAVIAFLCLPAASYMTGQVLPVDGGFLSLGF